MATTHTTLTALAHQAAAEIGFTARRWWRDTVNPSVLRVEVERRLVGAPPAVAELTVAIPSPPGPQKKRAPAATTGRKHPTTRSKPITTRSKRTIARGRKKVSTRKA